MKKLLIITGVCTALAAAALPPLRNPAWFKSAGSGGGGGGGGGSFLPSDVDGLQFWFRSESLGALATEGGSVSNWPNSVSGHESWYLTNANSAQWPTLTNTFNGRTGTNALWFAGDVLRLLAVNASASAAFNVVRDTNDCSIIIVATTGGDSAVKSVWYVSTPTANSIRHQVIFGTTEAVTFSQKSLDSDAGTGLTGPVWPTNTAGIFHCDFVHTNKTAVTGSSLTLFTNNVQAATGAGATPTNTQDTASAAIRLGQGTSGSQKHFGLIAEVIVYVPALTAANRTNVYTYLKTKYGTP